MSKQTNIRTQVVVIGSGPGGYTAAFRAADLGLNVVLVERYSNIGGVCLNVGCIPSKALLHSAELITEAESFKSHGIDFGKPKIDVTKLAAWKDKVVGQLTGGLKALAKQRKVTIVHGFAQFTSKNQVKVISENKEETIVDFDNAIIAAGSRPVKLPFLPEDPRIIDSTGALQLKNTKGSMLVLGGGIIGLEMATVYNALGVEISIVEMQNQLVPGADKDLIKVYAKRIKNQYKNIMLETKVTKIDAKKDGLYVTFEGKDAPKEPQKFDQVLVAVGRVPNGKALDADKAGVNVDERGFIAVDKQQRTNVPHIFAIGDIVGNPMLAHKAIPEGKVAAEVIAGKKHEFNPTTIPSVAYTDPEIAWAGMSMDEAKAKGINAESAAFPWAASGRALSLGRSEGMTKLIFDTDTDRIIGGAIIGKNAGDLIAEVTLAIEMGCDAEDIALTIHPHPTVAETVAQAAEGFVGSITDLYMPKKPKPKKAANQ